MIVAFSSTILAIPIIMVKLKRNNQNSYFFEASEKDTFLPFFVMNLSVSLGVAIALFKFLTSINENEITGTKKFRAKIISSTLDPQ